jgi:putative membrane protein
LRSPSARNEGAARIVAKWRAEKETPVQRYSISMFIIPLLAGCGGSQPDEGQVARQSEASTPAAPVGATQAPLSSAAAPDAQSFVSETGETLLYEIAAARIALERTRSNAVRDYANMIVKANGEAAADLKTAAASERWIVPLGPDQRQKAALAALEKAADFDTAYLQQQRRAHEERLGDLRRFASKGNSRPLAAFAAEAAATVDRHRQILRRIETIGRSDGPTEGRGENGESL